MTKTVKVRIPVAVDQNGTWAAYGFEGHEIKDLDGLYQTGVGEELGGGERLYFVTAELSIPEPVTVPGTVVGQID